MQKSAEIQSRGLTLRGMVHIPEKTIDKIPMVCIFHGFTGNKMESHFIFVKLSRMLEAKGIASVRFDFGGSGESDGDFRDVTISKELEDANAILDYVRMQDYVDNDKIAVVGLSMGGAVASMLSSERKETVKTLCLWAPAGNMGQLIMKGRSKEEIDNVNKTGIFDIGGLAVGVDFIRDAQNLDIFQKSSQYDKKVLLLHGDKDMAVPLSTSKHYLEIYGEKASLHIISGADHTFNALPWEKEVIEHTLDFLVSEL